MTVRQAATTWPACAEFLEQCPGAKWEGRWSLQELGAFARSCGRDETALLNELAAVAGVPVALPTPSRTSRRSASPMPIIYVALLVALTLGAGWGVALLLKIAFGVDYGVVSGASVHVHGVAQLWGWMALFVFAVATHLLRQNTTRPAPPWLDRVGAACVLAALIAFFAGISAAVRHAIPAIDIVGSCLLMSAAILFAISIVWSLSGAAAGTQRKHGFVFLLLWLFVWAGADLWLRLRYRDASVLPDSARKLLIVLPVLGLATNAIYGFGIKLIPGILNIPRLRHGVLGVALMLHNIGLVLFLIPQRIAETAGAALMLPAAVLYLIGMNWLRGKPSRPIYGIDPRGHVLIRVGFFWLVVGLAMILVQQLFPSLPHAYSGAWRHALTVGFITTMILGVGHRIVPIFIKQPLASNWMLLVSAVLIIVGNAGRVVLELVTIGGWPWTFRAMGMTGVLELAALALFALNLLATARNRRRVYREGERLTPDVRVREAVNARPELQQRFAALGITMFDDAPFIAPSMTIGALALAEGRDPDDLVAALTPPAGASDR